jgi:hypothetical protein
MCLGGDPYSEEVEGWDKGSQNKWNNIVCAQSAIIRPLINTYYTNVLGRQNQACLNAFRLWATKGNFFLTQEESAVLKKMLTVYH